MDALREKIRRSEYVVDADAVAEAILDRLRVGVVAPGLERIDGALFERGAPRSQSATRVTRSGRSLSDRLTRRR